MFSKSAFDILKMHSEIRAPSRQIFYLYVMIILSLLCEQPHLNRKVEKEWERVFILREKKKTSLALLIDLKQWFLNPSELLKIFTSFSYREFQRVPRTLSHNTTIPNWYPNSYLYSLMKYFFEAE